MSLLLPLTSLATATPDPGGYTFYLPPQHSTAAPEVDLVFHAITWLCYFFFFLIVILLVAFVIRYRKPRGTLAEGNVSHNTPLELTWTIIPLFLVIGMFWIGLKGYLNLRRAPAESYKIDATAQKWYWNFSYINGCQAVDELYVPEGVPVQISMQSTDVLHALYIPDFRVKQDVVPGRITTLWFEALETGEVRDLDLYCAEYCGTEHSQMVGRVKVLPWNQFLDAIDECANSIDDYPDEELHLAGAIIWKRRCLSCHSLDGSALTGPSWDDLWARTEARTTVFSDGSTLQQRIDDGVYSGTDDYIMQSILNPQQDVVANYPASMPTFRGQLKPREIQAVARFMEHLDEFDAQGNYLGASGGGE